MRPQKHKYFYVILDDASNFGCTTTIAAKSDAFVVFKSVKAWWEKQMNK
jgi:hypothetical protein